MDPFRKRRQGGLVPRFGQELVDLDATTLSASFSDCFKRQKGLEGSAILLEVV